MASLEEINNIVQSLQQTIQQQQEKINNLERQVIERQQDILVLEDNLTNTKRELNQELEQTKQKLESQIQQNANLDAQIQRFNTLIDKLKGPNGETLRFACGSTEPGNTQWVQGSEPNDLYLHNIDTSSAGFSETCTPYYFTSLGGKKNHRGAIGPTSIYYSSDNKKGSFTIGLTFVGPITPVLANEWEWHIQWLAVGV